WNRGDGQVTELEFLLPGGPQRATGIHDELAAEALETAIDLFDVTAVHVENLIGHSLGALDVLARFDGPVVCSVRDLYLACPHHWLLFQNEEPCGIPSALSPCAECLPRTRGLVRDRRPGEVDLHLLEQEPLRLAFVGLGWRKKGLDAVNRLATAVNDSSIEVHHFGELREPAAPALICHGRYDNRFLPQLLA